MQAHRMHFSQNVSEAAAPSRSPRGGVQGARSRVVTQGHVVYPDLAVSYARPLLWESTGRYQMHNTIAKAS
jgi:hypothetical protein